MKYDKEATDKLKARYAEQPDIAVLAAEFNVPERSIIAKLSAEGIYKKKEYRNKRGEVPVKKEEYIERIAALMEINSELLDSLEKANKNVLVLLEKALS